MSRTKEIVNQIANKNLSAAKDSIEKELYMRAQKAVEDMKPEVMGNMVKEEEVDLDESATESVTDKLKSARLKD